VINDKAKEKETLYVDEPKGDKPIDSGSNNKRKDGKKRCIKKTIYYNSDASSSSPRDDDDEDSSSKKKTVNQNYSFDYSRFPYNSNAHLLSIPLGKPPRFDGDDYSFWSHKMCSHLFSLHLSVWEIVETGCILIVVIIRFLLMSKFIRMPRLILFCSHLYAGMSTTRLVAWTMPSKYGIPSKSLMRVTMPP
jgi:hypothetical protein